MLAAFALAVAQPATHVAPEIDCAYRLTAKNASALVAIFRKHSDRPNAADQAMLDNVKQAMASCTELFHWNDAKQSAALTYTLALYERDDAKADLLDHGLTLYMVDAYLASLGKEAAERALKGPITQQDEYAVGVYLFRKNPKLATMPKAEGVKAFGAFGQAMLAAATARRAKQEFLQD